ncbi:MAG: hypothetical protein P4L53_21895 [Candidatus Obscuribacterales bacterium]|nr:hypothetical protein [Candidatus Obscuribacterales bacterium]
MNSIQKEQILRVNCPGFGEENYFSVGKAKSLDAYKVIIVNPVSIFHLFDNDLKLQKEIDNDLADGLTSRTVASDSLLQSIQEELKTRRILELVSFLEKGGLLIYYLCRPFLVQGDNIAIDNYAWLESLAPDSSPDDNIRHMSAVSHGRVVEATPDGELSEFAPYLSQTGLEWNTIIRQDFLTDGYKPLATAGPRKCIAAQLMAGDQGGRILFLPAPYSPDFDKKLIECVQDWNIKTHHVEAVAAPVAATVQAPVLAVAEPVPPAVAAVAPAAVPVVDAPAAVVAAPVPTPGVAETPVAVVTEPAPLVAVPAPIAAPPAPVAAPPAPVAAVEAPTPAAVIPNSAPVVEPPAQTTPIITPPPPVESAVIITPPPAPTPEIVVAPVGVVETPVAESIVASSSPIITPPPPAPVVSEPAALVTPAPEVVVTDAEATQNLVREMELLAQANPSAGNSSSFTPPAPAAEPVGAKIARGLFGDDDDDDRLHIGSPAFTGQSVVPQTASVEAAVSPVVATPAPHVTPAPLIQTLIAASEMAAAAPVISEAVVPVPTAEALIPAIDETQEMKARQYMGSNIQHSLDLDAIELEEVHLSTPAEVIPQTPVEEPKFEVEVPVVDTTAQIESTSVNEGVLPAVSPLSSLPIEVIPMPEVATASDGKTNGNGNGNGHHSEETHENYKAEEVDLANSLSSNSDLALFGVDAKQPEAKDLIKKMEEISKNTNSDVTFDIVLPQSEELRKKRVSLLDSIKQAQVEIANVENKITQIEHLKNALLRGEGDELVAACQRILTKLGWDAQPSEKSEQELYLLASDKPQALARVVRSTAQAKRTDVAELGESVCSFWGEHEIEAKGLMLASTWAERTLSERQEQDYTDGLAQFAQKKSLCLMTTLQLLCMYRDVEMGRLTADEARNRILDTNGRLAGFQVESPLVTV